MMAAADSNKRVEGLDEEDLGQLVHDAYERVTLDEAACERMLSSLRVAQGKRASHPVVPEGGTRQDASTERSATTEPVRSKTWFLLVPCAAALLAALVVVRVGFMGGADRTEATMPSAGVENAPAAANEKVSYEDAAAPDALAAGVESNEAEVRGSASSPVERYPLILLEDDTMLTTLSNDGSAVEVDASEVGPSKGTAMAMTPNSDAAVDCEAFELVGRTDVYAVRYEGEDRYWLCVPVGR